MIQPPPDSFCIRCPRLGHQIYFSYCEREQGNLPCFKAVHCWRGIFPVEAYFRERLQESSYEKVFMTPPKPKIVSLVELIQKAKEGYQK